MNKFLTLFLSVFLVQFSIGQDLIITAIFDGPLSGGKPKALELYVVNDIADLSVYSVVNYNNGNTNSSGSFALTGSATAGDFLYAADDMAAFNSFFGFNPDFDVTFNVNGDDAVELQKNGIVEDVYGVVGTDGTGEVWEYLDGWAYRNDNDGPNTTFTASEWTFSGPNAMDGETSNTTATNPLPIGTYSQTSSTCSISNISISSEACSGNDYEFEVSFTSTNTSGSFEVIDEANSNVVLASGTTSPILVTITNNSSTNDLEVNVWDINDNSCLATAVTVTPQDCTTATCSIASISAGTQSTCDAATNTYTQEITVTYSDEPTLGTLDVNGQSFTITSSPQTIVLTNLVSDGNPVNVTASFSAEASCTLTENNLFTAPASCIVSTCATANINEFHYDNAGADMNEFVEVFIADPQPTNLIDYKLNLYNGNNGTSYNSETLDNATATLGTGGTYYVWYPSSMQNGAPDGISLSGPSSCGLIEFISYEGDFMATDGPASGATSTDVGVQETNSLAVGSAIQLIGGTWTLTEGSNSAGAENTSNASTCSIASISAGTQSTCDAATNTYTQEITVTYSDEPTSGTLDVNGQSFTITSSPQTIVLTNLVSDGNPVNVTASFSADASCTLTENNLFTAPADCSGPSVGLVLTGNSICNDGAGTDANINKYYIEITNVTGGDGTYEVTIDGETQSFSGATLVFGPYDHSGNGGQVKMVSIDDENGETGTFEITEALCGYDQNAAFCQCETATNYLMAGAIMSQSEPGTFQTGGTSGVTQFYVLTDVNTGEATVLDVNETGLFEGLANGDYFVFAINADDNAATNVLEILDGSRVSFNVDDLKGATGDFDGECFKVCGEAPYTVDCNCCLADAGDIVSPNSTNNEEICLGDDLGVFTVDYSAGDENLPDAANYSYAFILADNTGSILDFNANGDFDFSNLNAGTFSVYGLSYFNDNTPTDIMTYLGSVSSISEIETAQDDPNTEPTCLDLDNATENGVIAITIYPLPDAPSIDDVEVCDGEVAVISSNSGGGSTPVVLYSETFDTDGEGVTGECTGTEISTCAVNVPASNGQWTISGVASGLTATSDYLQTNNGKLEGRDVMSELIWTSSNIDITGETVDFSVNLSENGTLEAGDYITVSLIVDGSVVETQTEADDFTSTTVSFTGITGSDLVVEIRFLCNSGSEYLFADDVSVQTGVSTGNITYNFYDADPSGTATLLATGSTYEPGTTLATSPETYWVTEVDANGCEGEATEVKVTVFENPTAALSSNDICQYLTEEILSNVTGGATPYTYTWTDLGTGSANGYVLVDNTAENLEIDASAVDITGTVNLNFEVIDANNCSFSVDYSIEILEGADMTSFGDITLCEGESTQIPQPGLVEVLLGYEDFDGGGIGFSSSQTFHSSNNDYWEITDGSDIYVQGDGDSGNGFEEYSFEDGTNNFWAAEDVDASGSNGNSEQQFNLNTIDLIPNLESVQFCFEIAAGNEQLAGASNYDLNDYVTVQFATDDNPTFRNIICNSYMNANGDNFNEPFGTDPDCDPSTNDGVQLTTVATQICYEFTADDLANATEIDIQILVSMDSGNEEIAFDNLKVFGLEPQILTDTYNFYDADPTNGGTVLAAGVTSYDVDVNINNSPVTVWVQAINPNTGCPSEAEEVVVEMLPRAPQPIVMGGSLCKGSCFGANQGLMATGTCEDGSAAIINWYESETSTSILYTGEVFSPIDFGLVDNNIEGKYTFYVETDCGTACGSFRVPVVLEILDCGINTETCGECVYFLQLYDAAQNGWGGAQLMLGLSEGELQSYKLTANDNGFKTFLLPINDGQFIDFMYMNGGADTENSYKIINAAGETVFQDGPMFSDVERPLSGVNNQIKSECGECCSDTEDFEFVLTNIGGSQIQGDSWELTDWSGQRVAYGNAGSYDGILPGEFVVENYSLTTCESYNFTAFSASNSGWNLGLTIYSTNPNRGKLVTSGPFKGKYEIFVAPPSFNDEYAQTFTLPCQFECVEEATLLANNGCEFTGFIAEDIEPIICYPNNCHGSISPIVEVYFPTAIPGDTTILLGQSVDLPVGDNEYTYIVSYVDGQIIRCTSTITIQSISNPSFTCNDNITISLDNYSYPDCALLVLPDMVVEAGNEDCLNEFYVELYTENEELIGSYITTDMIGETIIFAVKQYGEDGNYCWGNLTVEDKSAPVITVNDYEINCNHPEALNENWEHTVNLVNEFMPANIAGGSANTPSETVMSFETGCGAYGEIVKDVNIKLNITHNDLEDLKIELHAPNGDKFILLDYLTCNNLGTKNLELIFDMESTNSISNSNCTPDLPGLSGTYKASESFSSLYGKGIQELSGDWLIVIYDNDNRPQEGTGYGEVTFAEIELVLGFPTPYVAYDCNMDNVELLSENFAETFCDQGEWNGAYLERTWKATDIYGNSSIATQRVNMKAPSFDQLVLPQDITFQCGEIDNPESLENSGAPAFACFDIPNAADGFCDLSYTYEDKRIETCGSGYKINRTWTVVNWCSGVEHTIEQLIKVEDTEGPQIVIDNIVQNSGDGCSTNLVFENVAEDNCSGVNSVMLSYYEGKTDLRPGTLKILNITNGGELKNLPYGETEMIFVAIDGCGNENRDTILYVVKDADQPIAQCDDQLNITLGSDGTARVKAEDIDEGSYDECSDVTLEVRRIDGCKGRTPWGATVQFECCDANSFVTVELKVTDEAGNEAICWQNVLVEDPTSPTITAPADTIITCKDEVVFGEPEYSDNCGHATIDYVDQGELDECKAGVLRRTWTVSDGGDKSDDVTATQKITVEHISDFVVSFPADQTITNCGEALDTIRPTISDDDCELIAVSFSDEIATVVEDACYQIIRTWTVYNWCIVDLDAPNTDLGLPLPLPRTYKDNGDGYFRYTQVIKIIDTEAPTLTCEATLAFDAEAGCEGFAALTVDASDNCTEAKDFDYNYQIDLNNDGSFDDQGNTDDASGDYPTGTHRIAWQVSDGCGNISTCEQIFVIKDAKNPTPVVRSGLATVNIQGSGCVEIWASDFLLYAEDNCSTNEYVEGTVKMRLANTNNPLGKSLEICCEDIQESSTVLVEIWVSDESQNTDFATSYINVVDNNEVCPETVNRVTVAGKIVNNNEEAIEGVMVEMMENVPALPTNEEGQFGLKLDKGHDYTITPSKSDMQPDALTTYDVIMIINEILGRTQSGLPVIESAYQLIAADVNGDKSIDILDVIELRQIILGIKSEFSISPWVFVDKSYKFENENNPLLEDYPTFIKISDLEIQTMHNDFIGFHIGDVNRSAKPNKFAAIEGRSTGKDLTFSVEDKILKPNETYKVEIKAKDFKNVLGFQFTLDFTKALQFEGFESGAIQLTENNFGLNQLYKGFLTNSWNGNEMISVDNDEVLFTLEFRAKRNVRLSEVLKLTSKITKTEAYLNSEISDVRFSFKTITGAILATQSFELYQNVPNPFNKNTLIGFELPKASFATLIIYNVDGKVIKTIEGDFQKGYNSIEINATDMDTKGVLFYQLDTEDNTGTKKMMILD